MQKCILQILLLLQLPVLRSILIKSLSNDNYSISIALIALLRKITAEAILVVKE